VEPIQLPIETSADKVASVVEQGAAAEDVQLSVPAQPINIESVPEQYDLIYQWKALVRSKVTPEPESELAPTLETDTVSNLG
jgi:hypothetical protein